jgi:hypothetical protein
VGIENEMFHFRNSQMEHVEQWNKGTRGTVEHREQRKAGKDARPTAGRMPALQLVLLLIFRIAVLIGVRFTRFAVLIPVL